MVMNPLNYSFITTCVSRYNHYILYTTIYASLAAMRTIITYNYVNWYLFTVLLLSLLVVVVAVVVVVVFIIIILFIYYYYLSLLL